MGKNTSKLSKHLQALEPGYFTIIVVKKGFNSPEKLKELEDIYFNKETGLIKIGGGKAWTSDLLVTVLYEEHIGREFYPRLRAYLGNSETPEQLQFYIVAKTGNGRGICEHGNAVGIVRHLNGTTEPSAADKASIRGAFGLHTGMLQDNFNAMLEKRAEEVAENVTKRKSYRELAAQNPSRRNKKSLAAIIADEIERDDQLNQIRHDGRRKVRLTKDQRNTHITQNVVHAPDSNAGFIANSRALLFFPIGNIQLGWAKL